MEFILNLPIPAHKLMYVFGFNENKNPSLENDYNPMRH